MSLAELLREIESRKRQQKAQLQERATFDYILADLIGRSMARLHSSANHMPKLREVYPSLFDDVEQNEEVRKKADEASAIRFRQFANTYNSKYKGVAKKE